MPKKSVVPRIATDPLAELERKLDALALRVDEISVKPIAQVLGKHPAMLGADPAGQLIDQWRSIRDRCVRGASVARVYLARVVVTPWAGAACLALVLSFLQTSIALLVIAVALSAAAVSTTAVPPSTEKSRPA